MSEFSRRDILGAGAAAGAAALAGCAGGASVSFASWTPEPGTWPLARYDPGNSGHNPHATPPTAEPDSAWEIETGVSATGLVLSADRLAAYGEQGLVVVRLDDHSVLREESDPAEVAGFRPPANGSQPLYAAGRQGSPDDTSTYLLRGWNSADKESTEAFRRPYEVESSRFPIGLIADDDALYVGHYATTVLSSGSRPRRARPGGGLAGCSQRWARHRS